MLANSDLKCVYSVSTRDLVFCLKLLSWFSFKWCEYWQLSLQPRALWVLNSLQRCWVSVSEEQAEGLNSGCGITWNRCSRTRALLQPFGSSDNGFVWNLNWATFNKEGGLGWQESAGQPQWDSHSPTWAQWGDRTVTEGKWLFWCQKKTLWSPKHEDQGQGAHPGVAEWDTWPMLGPVPQGRGVSPVITRGKWHKVDNDMNYCCRLTWWLL